MSLKVAVCALRHHVKLLEILGLKHHKVAVGAHDPACCWRLPVRVSIIKHHSLMGLLPFLLTTWPRVSFKKLANLWEHRGKEEKRTEKKRLRLLASIY